MEYFMCDKAGYAQSFGKLTNSTSQMNKTTTSTPSSSKFSQKKKNFRSMNLELDAPQWTDFISASPQVSCDDYFSKWHDENEYREKENLSINSCTSDSPCKEKENFNCSVNENFKETTYENVLTEAMNNLQMTVKIKSGDKSVNKLCLVESPAVKSLNKRFTRSMCSEFDKSVKFKDHGRTDDKENCSITRCLTPANKKKHVKQLSSQQLLKVDSTKECKSPESDKILHSSDSNSDSHDSPLTDQSLQLNLEVTATSTEHEVSEEKLEPELEANEKNESSNNIEESKVKSDANIPKSKIVTSFCDHEVSEEKQLSVPAKKIVSSIVSIDEKGVVKEEKVLYFGIPCKTKKQNTKIMPFSFEARNKELQKKKQEKLKEIEESKQQKIKAEFHARPVPAAVKTPINKKPVKNTTPKITVPRSLSLERRHQEMQKRKEEKIKQILEEEKQTRTFRAQKVPKFKPVMVRGRSRDRSNENLSVKSDSVKEIKTNSKVSALKRSEENLTKTTNLIKKPLVLDVATKKLKSTSTTLSAQNQTNKIQGTAPKILEPKCKLSQKSVAVLTKLNTDKRAKQRKEFDEQLKKKETTEQELKKKEEEERIKKEKAEKLELRKMTTIKARPMPVYKPMNVVKSSKPLTDAQSPAWANRKGGTH